MNTKSLALLSLLLIGLVAEAQDRIIILRPFRVPRVITRKPLGLPMGTLQQRIPVTMPSRFDVKWAAPPSVLADMPKDAPRGFTESYQLLLPQGFAVDQPQGLVLHLSASSMPNDYLAWQAVCQKHKLLYACPAGIGDDVHLGLRLKTALAVLDDLRQKVNLDPDRVYITGIGGGALVATMIAYGYPEFVGGVVAIGNATSLRAEPYLRDRARERLSIALLAGQWDNGRHELERVRAKVLEQSDMTFKYTTVPNLHANTLPPPMVLDGTIAWLESNRAKRVQLAGKFPPSRIVGPGTPKPEEWAGALVEEGKFRMQNNRTDEGISLLEGVIYRWPATPAAKDAKAALEAHDARGKRAWADWHAQRQRIHFVREATALDDYVKTIAAVRGLKLTPGLIEATMAMYEQVITFGPETKDGERALKRIEELKRLAVKR
mgnify:CR=1 FL=1